MSQNAYALLNITFVVFLVLLIDIRFSNEHNRRQLGDIMTVLSQPRLWVPTAADYPRHKEWLGKSEAQIAEGTKRALLAYVGANPVGAIVYRRHEAAKNIVEIRNISIDPEVHGRLFGAFMLRQVETDSLAHDFPGTDTLTVDTKATNGDMIAFLEKQGFRPSDAVDLYSDGTGMDVVLTKSLVS